MRLALTALHLVKIPQVVHDDVVHQVGLIVLRREISGGYGEVRQEQRT